MNLSVNKLPKPRRLILADDEASSAGAVTHAATTSMKLGNHLEEITWFITKLNCDAILGLPWLQEHDPIVKFGESTIIFNSRHCLAYCNKGFRRATVRCLQQKPQMPTRNQDIIDAIFSHTKRDDTKPKEEGSTNAPDTQLNASDGPQPDELEVDGSTDETKLEDTEPQELATSQAVTSESLGEPTGFRLMSQLEAQIKSHPEPPPRTVNQRHTPRKRIRWSHTITERPHFAENEEFHVRAICAINMMTFCRQKGVQAELVTVDGLHKRLEMQEVTEELCDKIYSGKISIDDAKAGLPKSTHNFVDKIAQARMNPTDSTELPPHLLPDHITVAKITDEDATKFLDKQNRPEHTDEQLKALIPKAHHGRVAAFRKSHANTLPPHRPSDTKIDLKPGGQPPYHRTRPFSATENKVIKAWLDEQLDKGFIRRSVRCEHFTDSNAVSQVQKPP
jgi:hypothetical protein